MDTENIDSQNVTNGEGQPKRDESRTRNNKNTIDVDQDLKKVKKSTPVKSIRRCGGKIVKKLTEEELNLKFLKRDIMPAESNSDALTPPPSPSSANTPVIHGNLPETAVVVGFVRNGKMHFLVTNRPLGEKQIRDGNLKGKMGKIVKNNLKNRSDIGNDSEQSMLTKAIINGRKASKSISGIENDDPEKNLEEKHLKTSRLGRKIQPSVRLQDLGSVENKNKKIGMKFPSEKNQEEEKVLKTSRLGRKVQPSVRLQDLGSVENKNKKLGNKDQTSPKKKKIPITVNQELDKISKNNSESPHGPRGALKPRTSFKVRKILKSYSCQQSRKKIEYEQSYTPYQSPKKIDIDSLLAKAPSKSILKNPLNKGYPPRIFDRTIEGGISPETEEVETNQHLKCLSGFKLNVGSLIRSPKKSTKKSMKGEECNDSSNLHPPTVNSNIYLDRMKELSTPDIDQQIFSNLPSSLDNISTVSSVSESNIMSKSPEHVEGTCDLLVTDDNHISDDDNGDQHDSMDVVSPEHIQELSSITPEDVQDTLGVTGSGDMFQESPGGMLSSELFSEPLYMEASPSRFDPEPLTPPSSSGESSPPCEETSEEEPIFGPLKMVMPNGK
ncbi:unnamed protein product, partial [Meganyctiphanes norvegica]